MKSYQELVEMAKEISDIKHCDVCGVPFLPRHSRQKTCGSEECKKKHHNRYVANYLKENDEARERQRIRNREFQRAKRKALSKVENEDIEEKKRHYDRLDAFDKKIAEYGDHYGEVSKQKILRSVPPIKTEL